MEPLVSFAFGNINSMTEKVTRLTNFHCCRDAITNFLACAMLGIDEVHLGVHTDKIPRDTQYVTLMINPLFKNSSSAQVFFSRATERLGIKNNILESSTPHCSLTYDSYSLPLFTVTFPRDPWLSCIPVFSYGLLCARLAITRDYNSETTFDDIFFREDSTDIDSVRINIIPRITWDRFFKELWRSFAKKGWPVIPNVEKNGIISTLDWAGRSFRKELPRYFTHFYLDGVIT